MMRNTLCILFSYLGLGILYSQNLVPNYSFEQYSACPTGAAQIDRAVPWFQPNTCCGPGGSSDYFNQCATGNPWIYVPQNNFGFQQGRTGVAYAGIAIVYPTSNNVREYIEIQLNDSLIVGNKYCVEFYVSLANTSKYASNNIGAYFSKNIVQYSNTSYPPILVTPQVNESNIIYDTTNWVSIAGTFVAIGGEKYLTIGNFYNDAGTNIDSLLELQDQAYYFIDDISVTPSPTANAGADITINEGSSVQLSASGGGIYSWYPSTGLSCIACSNPVASPNATTTYYVVVNDSFACGSDTDSITVFVIQDTIVPAPVETLFIPNAFSPNGDGENDFLYVKGSIKEMQLEIYNRWGEQVFESNEQSTGWDGKNAPSAVYVYYLRATMNDGKAIFQKGNVTLLR